MSYPSSRSRAPSVILPTRRCFAWLRKAGACHAAVVIHFLAAALAIAACAADAVDDGELPGGDDAAGLGGSNALAPTLGPGAGAGTGGQPTAGSSPDGGGQASGGSWAAGDCGDGPCLETGCNERSGTGFWQGWCQRHGNAEPRFSWDTDGVVGLMPHNSVTVAPALSCLDEGAVVDIEMEVKLNTEGDYQSHDGYGTRACGGGHLVNLWNASPARQAGDDGGYTCEPEDCPAGVCASQVEGRFRMELVTVRSTGFGSVVWPTDQGPNNYAVSLHKPGLGWTHGKWLRFRWTVELLENGGLRNRIRQTLRYLSVAGTTLPQPEHTVVNTSEIPQPGVEWRRLRFVGFGNYDLCSYQSQDELGKIQIRNIVVH